MAAGYEEQALKQYLDLLPEFTRGNVKPVTPATLGQRHLLHMSKDTAIQSFEPSVSVRTLSAENRSVPRICTAPTLAGCIMGYTSDVSDFMSRPTGMSQDRKRKVNFLGGWIVYGFEFDVALRPTAKLLPDVERTDEHWLITYNNESVTYRPTAMAKFFYQTVQYRAGGKYPQSEVELLVEVLTDTPIRFTEGCVLTKGCWKLRVRGLHDARRWDRIPTVEASPYSQRDYNASKQLVASMLSLEDLTPPSGRW